MALPEVITGWKWAVDRVAYWTNLEREERKKIVGWLKTPGKDKGTETKPLSDGYSAKMKHTTYVKLKNDNGQVDYLRANLPEAVFENLIKTTYSINEKAYLELGDAEKAWLDWCVELTPGLPTLELIEPEKGTVI